MGSDSWEETTLGASTRVRRGASPRPIDDPVWFADNGPGWVRISDVTRSVGKLRETKQHLSPAGVSKTVAVHPGQVIMSICATIGEPIELGMEACIHDGFVVFDQHESSLDGRFLVHHLRRMQSFFRSQGQTGTQANLNTGIVNASPLRRPPLPEQQLIASILDTVDEVIRKTEEVIAKLQQMKQGLLHDLLTRGIDDNGELRDPDRHPEQFKDSPLGRIPKDWEVEALERWVRGDAAITYGIVQAGPHVDGGIPYVRTGDMSGERLSREGLLCTTRSIANSYRRSEVRAGEIVFAIRATVGKVLPVPVELDGANLTQGTARVSPGPRVRNLFLLWALRSHAIKRQIDRVQKGTTFSEITLGQLRKLMVACPNSDAEQEAIESRLEANDALVRAEQAELNKLRLLKSGLMDDLLTGRVRVTDLLPTTTP